MVVLPAASNPTIKIRFSFLPQPSNNLVKKPPIEFRRKRKRRSGLGWFSCHTERNSCQGRGHSAGGETRLRRPHMHAREQCNNAREQATSLSKTKLNLVSCLFHLLDDQSSIWKKRFATCSIIFLNTVQEIVGHSYSHFHISAGNFDVCVSSNFRNETEIAQQQQCGNTTPWQTHHESITNPNTSQTAQ